jgi:hypothetical protein
MFGGRALARFIIRLSTNEKQDKKGHAMDGSRDGATDPRIGISNEATGSRNSY